MNQQNKNGLKSKQPSSRAVNEDKDLLELSSDDSFEDNESELPFEKVALRRMAIIDTLNVLHQCADHSKYARTGNFRCEAIGVLLLCWKLLKQDFDLKLFIMDSYMTGVNRDKVANHFILRRLQTIGYLTTIRTHGHDDLHMLEYAKCTGGFIISNDKFRDHARTFERIQTQDEASVEVIKKRVAQIRFHPYPPEKLSGGKRALASNNGIGYLGMDFSLKIDDKNVMYATPDDPTYGVVFAQRMVRKQQHALNALDQLGVMCEYFRQELCEIHMVCPPRLPYFDPMKSQLGEYDAFHAKWEQWTERERVRVEEVERQQRVCRMQEKSSNDLW